MGRQRVERFARGGGAGRRGHALSDPVLLRRLVFRFAARRRRDRSRHAGEIDRLIKNLPNKSQALAALSRADGFQHKLYEGTREIPDLLSNNARLNQYGYLIHGYGESGLPIRKGWDYFNDNYLFLWMHRIEYVDESH